MDFDMAAPSKKSLQRKSESPGPIKFMAIPLTTWSAAKFTVAMA